MSGAEWIHVGVHRIVLGRLGPIYVANGSMKICSRISYASRVRQCDEGAGDRNDHNVHHGERR